MQEIIKKNLGKRYKKEAFFKKIGFGAIAFALLFLVTFLSVIFIKGNRAFTTHKIKIEIDFSKNSIAKNSDLKSNLGIDELIAKANYRGLIQSSFDAKSKSQKIYEIVSENAEFDLGDILRNNPEFIGKKRAVWLDVSSKTDIYLKYKISSQLSKSQENAINKLFDNGEIKSVFNWKFFTEADSREPESAGIAASLTGSFLVMMVFLIFAFPIAVMCAFYLEEFAPKNKLTDLIEISINNLAAIPSIIYGLLGLTIYLQFMDFPRSSALVGGMTLFMLVLPVVIIATRNTIRTIPQSIRDAALGLGASKVQIMLHHLFPLCIPGIMTGTILAMSRALGETAPLLMIGMVAFIADVATDFVDPTTVLPVQIYLWSDSPELGFAEKTSAAIMVLLGFLILFNLIAIVIRKKFERKW